MVTPRRKALPTVGFIDNYCQAYQNLFSDVRNYEAFKLLHLGMLSEIPRKSLTKIARAVGLKNSQGLNHFLSEAHWNVEKVREIRLWLTKLLIGEREITLCLDETGDAKKGKTTDYVARQYIGNLGKTKNGIVSVNAYAIVEGITYPLLFKIFKPRKRLKAEDTYKTKPQLAIEIIKELQKWNFNIKLVLADSLYGESGDVITALEESNLEYIVAIRSNHKVWMFGNERKRYNRWKSYQQIVSIQANYFQLETIVPDANSQVSTPKASSCFSFSHHPWWEKGNTWKSSLNNLRLIIQPLIFYHLIKPWFDLFPNQHLQLGLSKLINSMNRNECFSFCSKSVCRVFIFCCLLVSYFTL